MAVKNILNHIGPCPSVDRADLILGHTVACIDGRRSTSTLGVPGGSSGMVLVLVDTWEHVREGPLAADEFDRLLADILDLFGTLYLHTDEGAAAFWTGAKAPGDHDARPDELLRLIVDPPIERRAELLERLADARAIGCGHLKLLHSNPEGYGTRPGLVSDLLRAYFRRLWSGDSRLEFEILSGGHHEEAVLHLVSNDQPIVRYQSACPHAAEEEVFVHHPQVADDLLTRQAAFLVETGRVSSKLASFALRRQRDVYYRWLNATAERLAGSLPHFTAAYTNGAPVSIRLREGAPSHQE